jgi:hypothetical protein
MPPIICAALRVIINTNNNFSKLFLELSLFFVEGLCESQIRGKWRNVER